MTVCIELLGVTGSGVTISIILDQYALMLILHKQEYVPPLARVLYTLMNMSS
jgi:hypothetical protein